MAEIIFSIIVIFWYGFALYVSEIQGRKSKLDVEWLFFIAMVFSPLAALIVIKFGPKKPMQA
jgi:hypothetical protein